MIGQPETCLQCPVSVARHHGIELAVEHLRHSYAIADGSITDALLLRMAREGGLCARLARPTWDKLAGLGQAYPNPGPPCQRQLGCRGRIGKNAAGEEAVEVLDPRWYRPTGDHAGRLVPVVSTPSRHLTHFQQAMMMDVDQAAKATRDEEMLAEIEDFIEGFNKPTYRGMRINGVRVATWSSQRGMSGL
jgi:hypothetical protein